jgi:hypothetical protein
MFLSYTIFGQSQVFLLAARPLWFSISVTTIQMTVGAKAYAVGHRYVPALPACFDFMKVAAVPSHQRPAIVTNVASVAKHSQPNSLDRFCLRGVF